MKNSTSCRQPLTKAGYLLGHLDVTRLLAALALEDSSSVLVELEGSDDNVGGVDANRGSSSVALLNVDSVDVDDPLLPVDLGDLALSALVLSSDNQNLVVLPDGDGSGVVLLSELLGQGGRHELPLEAGRGREVRLARLAAVRSEAYPFKSVSVYSKPKYQTSHLGRGQGRGRAHQASRQAGRKQVRKVRGHGTGGLQGVVEPFGRMLTKSRVAR